MTGPAAPAGRRSFLRLMAIVARRDYLRTVRRRGFLFGTLLLPLGIAGLGLLTTAFTPSFEPPPPARLAVVNESALRLSLAAGEDVHELTRRDAMSALAAETIGEFYVIPADYPAAATIERVTLPDRSASLDQLQRWSGQERLLAGVLRRSLLDESGLPPALLERVVDPLDVETVATDGRQPSLSFDMGFLLPYAFTFLFVISIFITSGYLLQSVTEEKESRVVELVLSSVPAEPLMAGKIVGLGAAGLTQVLIWVGTALGVLSLTGARMPLRGAGFSVDPATLALALAFFVAGYLAYGAIFAAIGAIAPGTREAQQYSGFFGFFAIIPMLFGGVFLTDPGAPLVTVLALIPLTAPAAMLQLLAVSPAPPWGLALLSLASVMSFAVLAALAASRVFRATVLLYGSRPSLGRIFAAITARG